jgi:hypothetical protein
MGHSNRSAGKPHTPGRELMVKASSLRKDRSKGTQRMHLLGMLEVPANAPAVLGNAGRLGNAPVKAEEMQRDA